MYQQLKRLVQTAVGQGALRPHQRIPSERDLGEQLGVSRMTVRLATSELIRDGVLYTRPGKGTFVAEVKIRQPLEHLTSFTEEMRARGLTPETRVLRQTLTAAGSAGEPLRIPPDAPVVVVDRLRLADGQPMAIERASLAAVRCPGLEACDLTRQSLYAVLRGRYGLTLTRAEQSIEAALPSAREHALLEIHAHDPVLHIERVTYLDDGSPLEFVSATYRGDRYRLQVTLRP